MTGIPPSLVTRVRRALDGEVALARGTSLLVAVSGGPDSMALLDVLARVADSYGLRLFAHGVDHGLRAEATAELDGAETLARSHSVPFARTRVRVEAGGNLQARARSARYDALATAARAVGAEAIATAHHAEDRAETFLLRLLRGSGARGLAVMPARARMPQDDALELVRPLLRARRSDVLLYVTSRAMPVAHDPSNLDPRFARVRIRTELLPLLAALDPSIVDHLEALADELADGAPGPGFAASLPRSTQHALEALVRDPSSRAEVWLPGGLVVRREDGKARAPRSRNAVAASPAPTARPEPDEKA